MLETTPWRPLSDERNRSQRMLEAALRAALPPLADCNTSHGLNGERRRDGACTTALQKVSLQRLEWHLQERGVCMQRAMAHWNFRGSAVLADCLVDFYGDYLRDMVTGAFYEFRLHAVGLPHD